MNYKIAAFILLTSLSNTCWSGKTTVNLQHGNFDVFDRNSGTVLAAPHGTYDINTGSILNVTCLKTKFSCVIAKGFTPGKIRINVNRPTEGAGMHSSKEPRTARAIELYEEYKSIVSRISNGEPDLYIEIHGSRINGIEVAHNNLSLGEARRLKNILTEEWNKLSTKKTPIQVQGIDKIKMTGNGVKKYGIVSELKSKFIQFEFSRMLRSQEALLSKFLLSTTSRISIELM